MDINILTAHSELPSNQLLKEAALNKTWSVYFISPNQDSQRPSKNPSITLVRLGLQFFEQGLKYAQSLKDAGHIVINDPQGISHAKNKWSSQQTLIQQQLPHVPTKKISELDSFNNLSHPFDSFPLIIKTLYGSQGVGVHLATSLHHAQEIANTYFTKGFDVLLQPFIKATRDLRLLVINDHVIACVNRQAPSDDFRTNWHRGGVLSQAHVSREIKQAALNFAQALGLQIAGIDVLETTHSFHLLEANDSPGLEGITQITKINIAGEIMNYFESLKNKSTNSTTA